MLIGLTDPMIDRATLRAYAEWLRGGGAEIVLLSTALYNGGLLALCDALVLSGGGDMHPKFYGREELLPLCKEVNEERDAFELAVLEHARRRRMPVLGICRGAQVLNVGFGGTLVPDIEKAGFTRHRTGDAVERLHPVSVEPGSQLHGILGTRRGEVNTFHHQAVDRPGAGLRASAASHDGLIEAVEPLDPDGGPFTLGVQWHPERMKNADSPFAAALLRAFLCAVRD
jgi:putative glutamine amidotransferase